MDVKAVGWDLPWDAEGAWYCCVVLFEYFFKSTKRSGKGFELNTYTSVIMYILVLEVAPWDQWCGEVLVVGVLQLQWAWSPGQPLLHKYECDVEYNCANLLKYCIFQYKLICTLLEYFQFGTGCNRCEPSGHCTVSECCACTLFYIFFLQVYSRLALCCLFTDSVI